MWYLQRIVIVHFFERKIENDEPTVEVLSKKVTCLVLLPFFASKVRDFSFYNWAYSCLLPFLLLLTADYSQQSMIISLYLAETTLCALLFVSSTGKDCVLYVSNKLPRAPHFLFPTSIDRVFYDPQQLLLSFFLLQPALSDLLLISATSHDRDLYVLYPTPRALLFPLNSIYCPAFGISNEQ